MVKTSAFGIVAATLIAASAKAGFFNTASFNFTPFDGTSVASVENVAITQVFSLYNGGFSTGQPVASFPNGFLTFTFPDLLTVASPLDFETIGEPAFGEGEPGPYAASGRGTFPPSPGDRGAASPAVPEPAILSIFGAALAGVGIARRSGL